MAEENGRQRIALALIVLGILARVAMASISWGTQDADAWLDFARKISQHGLIALYHTDPSFDHPPLAGYFAALALRVSRATGLSFPLVFKLPSILADAITCGLLWRIGSSRKCQWIAVVFAWNLNSILVSAHHCNTDSIYAMLCLASVYAIESRGAHLLGGLILGAAINVKLIPVLLLIPMFALLWDRKSIWRFVAGLAIASIPFLLVLIFAGRDFASHAIGYSSFIDNWGVELILQKLARYPRLSTIFGPAVEPYQLVGRVIVIAAVLLVSLIARRNRCGRYDACARAAAIFLIFTPGFGIQYTAFVTPLLLAASPIWGTIYVVTASAMAMCWYGLNWNGTFPITNPPGIQLQGATMIGGVIVWSVLIAFVARSSTSPSRSSPDDSP